MESRLSAPGLAGEMFSLIQKQALRLAIGLLQTWMQNIYFFSGTFIEIIIPAVVGGLLFLFFTSLLIVLLCKRKQSKKEEALEKQRNVIHIERLHRGNDNVMISLEDTSHRIWRVKGKR